MEIETPKVSLDLNNIIRFGGIGGVIVLIAVNESEVAAEKLEKLGGLVTFLIIIIVGHIFYSLYRYFLYDHLLSRLQDFFYRKPRHNYRTYLSEKLNCSAKKAQWFYEDELRKNYDLKSYSNLASTIHLLYMTFTVLFIYGTFLVIRRSDFNAFWYIVAAIIIGTCGFLIDRRYEQLEYRLVKSEPLDKLAERWQKYIS